MENLKVNILQAIFFDKFRNWERFVEKHRRKIRPVVINEVEKFHSCGDIRKGYRLFVCEGCHDVKLFPLKCKGKFCPTCAAGESQRWSEMTGDDTYHVMHRHVIFTIDEGLRDIFLMEKHREVLLKGLMDEAAGIILNFYGKHRARPGIIAALHTFGSKLEFNPHVHMVVTMGGITKDGKWQLYDYLPYGMLRKYWQNAVLKLIRRTLTEWEKRRVQKKLQAAYTNNAEGFYVHAPKRSRINTKELLKYISRYMKRGPIALDRILMYDGEEVLFQYHDKRTNTKESQWMTAEGFIGALIRHIPGKNFKTIRRYGIYSCRIKALMKKVMAQYQALMHKLVVNAQRRSKPKKWQERIHEEFGEDPLKCKDCGEYYEFMGISVFKNEALQVQYANNDDARRYMKEENRKIEGKTFQNEYEKTKERAFEAKRFDWERQREIYMSPMWNA